MDHHPAQESSSSSKVTVPEREFIVDDFSGTVLETLNQMRSEGGLTDVIISVGQKEIHCHRAVLAAGSEYFRAMFSSNLREGKEERVRLHELNSEAVTSILDFAYTGRIKLRADNVQDILETADYLQYRKVVKECGHFLASNFDLETAPEIYNVADRFSMKDLVDSVENYIRDNFDKYVQSPHFYELSHTTVSTLLADDLLKVESEQLVFKALMAWIEHDRAKRVDYLPELLSQVRLPVLTMSFLETLLTASLLSASSECVALVKRAIDHKLEVAVIHGKRSKPRKHSHVSEVMVVVGGILDDGIEPDAFLDVMLLKDDDSICKLTSITYDPTLIMYSVAAYRNNIYISGGSGLRLGHSSSAEVWSYSVESDAWTKRANLIRPRYQHCMAVYDGKLYAISGYCNQECLHSIECYDDATDQWWETVPIPVPVSCASATAFDSKLYVVGGMTAHGSSVDIIQYFDGNQWDITPKKSSFSIPKGSDCAVLNEKIYIIGGADKRALCFDPKSETIAELPPTNHVHLTPGVCTFQGLIYITGGNDPFMSTTSVECYDPAKGAWARARRQLLSPVYWHGCVTVLKDTSNLPPPLMEPPILPPRPNPWGIVTLNPSLAYRQPWEVFATLLDPRYDPR